MDIKALQAPLKQAYQADPARAQVVLVASGVIDFARVTCALTSARSAGAAGLHPATGGTGEHACSGEMLLEALVACSGVTCAAVATAMQLSIRAGSVRAEGDWDARGTLGVSREAPVGFVEIRLGIELDTDATDAELEQLAKLTDRYCVVLQTLRGPSPVRSSLGRRAAPGAS